MREYTLSAYFIRGNRFDMIHPRTLLLTLALAILAACAATPELPEDVEMWAQLLEERTLQDLAEHHPEALDDLDRAVGYAIFTNHADKMPAVGRGVGLGMVVDAEGGRRQYLSVTQFYVGGGLGTLDYRLVVVFFDRAPFERMRGGTLYLGASIDAGTGTEKAGFSGSSVGRSKDGTRSVYVLSDSGATATWTVRLVRYVPLEID